MIAPDEPFLCSRSERWIPREMIPPPALDRKQQVGPVEPHYALLINPFYSKDGNASFGKHVLTPSLALTSFAATTPEHWRVQYWDENLLDGRPPFRPMPGVVGITVHLTFARRAFELADWYRARGAKVVFGGLHVLSCPDECAPHADALALGDGVQLWPRILGDIEANTLQSRYLATYENDYREDPSPRRSLLPRRSFLTTTSLIATRGCHNRCGFCYLAKDVFARTAEWIEENRLECATFHILTPYPATPLFRQMEAQERILHRDWALYDTGHAVFQPKHMTAEELEHGYAWIYQRLFSHASIWRRRPRVETWRDLQAVPLYLAMSYLYKLSNPFWHLLSKHHWVHPVWKPLVEMTRRRHLHYRRRLAQREMAVGAPGQVVSAGV